VWYLLDFACRSFRPEFLPRSIIFAQQSHRVAILFDSWWSNSLVVIVTRSSWTVGDVGRERLPRISGQVSGTWWHCFICVRQLISNKVRVVRLRQNVSNCTASWHILHGCGFVMWQ